jgi:hypothetical protein
MIDSVAENFKMRFSDFRSHATDIRIPETQVPVEVIYTVEKMQL